MYFTVPPNGVAKLHFGVPGAGPAQPDGRNGGRLRPPSAPAKTISRKRPERSLARLWVSARCRMRRAFASPRCCTSPSTARPSKSWRRQGGGPALIRDKDALGLVASTYKESAVAQALFDRPGRLYTGHRNNLYKGLVQELKKLEMQDQDNSDAIDKLLERVGMFPNLPTVFDGLDKLGIDSYRARAGQDGGQNGLAQHLRCPQVLRQVHREAPSQKALT